MQLVMPLMDVWVEIVLLVLLAIVCACVTAAQTLPPLKVFHGRFIPDAPFPDLFALGFFFRNVGLMLVACW